MIHTKFLLAAFFALSHHAAMATEALDDTLINALKSMKANHTQGMEPQPLVGFNTSNNKPITTLQGKNPRLHYPFTFQPTDEHKIMLTRVWRAITIGKITEAYHATLNAPHLSDDTKTYILEFASDLLKKRVQDEVNIQALNDKMISLKFLASQSNDPFIQEVFLHQVEVIQKIRVYFSRWMDVKDFEKQTDRLISTFCLNHLADETSIDVRAAQCSDYLHALNNPYAFLHAYEISDMLGFE